MYTVQFGINCTYMASFRIFFGVGKGRWPNKCGLVKVKGEVEQFGRKVSFAPPLLMKA